MSTRSPGNGPPAWPGCRHRKRPRQCVCVLTLDLAHRLALQSPKQLGRLDVVHVDSRHQHRQQQPHAIHDTMPFAPTNILGMVPAALLTAAGRVHRLAILAGGGRGVRRQVAPLVVRPQEIEEDINNRAQVDIA